MLKNSQLQDERRIIRLKENLNEVTASINTLILNSPNKDSQNQMQNRSYDTSSRQRRHVHFSPTHTTREQRYMTTNYGTRPSPVSPPLCRNRRKSPKQYTTNRFQQLERSWNGPHDSRPPPRRKQDSLGYRRQSRNRSRSQYHSNLQYCSNYVSCQPQPGTPTLVNNTVFRTNKSKQLLLTSPFALYGISTAISPRPIKFVHIDA